MNPEIPPSFKQGKEEKEEKKGGGLPLFGKAPAGSSVKPALRLRGLSGGSSILERLKQFKKKDLAFILSGLGVLFLAPLAEHFIVGPGDEKVIKPGFDSKTGTVFTDAGAGYEAGTGGFAPGGLPGQSADVITPLNVRDPSALIMGMAGTQQPAAGAAAGSVAAPPSSAPKSESSWGDVVKDAAKSAGGKVREAAAPAGPKGTLAGSIRGLSSLSGMSYGGGPSASMAPISAGNVPNRPGEGRSLNTVAAAPGYRGVASHGLSQGQNSMEALKQAGGAQAGLFNKGGSAADNLQNAAQQAVNNGGGAGNAGVGPGGTGGGDKGSANSTKDSKSVGESLALMRQKMEMEKEVELEWKKKDWIEFDRPKMIQESIIKSFMDNVVGIGLFQPLGMWSNNMIQSLMPQSGGGGVYCNVSNPGQGMQIMKLPNTPKCKYRCTGSLGGVGMSAQCFDPTTQGPSGTAVICPGGCQQISGGEPPKQTPQPATQTPPTNVPAPDSPGGTTITAGQNLLQAQSGCQDALGSLNNLISGCNNSSSQAVAVDVCSKLPSQDVISTLNSGCQAMGQANQAQQILSQAQNSLSKAKSCMQGAVNFLGSDKIGASSGGQGQGQTAYSLFDGIGKEGGLAAKALQNNGAPLAPADVANVGTGGDLSQASKYYDQLAKPETDNASLKNVGQAAVQVCGQSSGNGPLIDARANLNQSQAAMQDAGNQLNKAGELLGQASSSLNGAANSVTAAQSGMQDATAKASFANMSTQISYAQQQVTALKGQVSSAQQWLTNDKTTYHGSALPAFGDGGQNGQSAVDAYRSPSGKDAAGADGTPTTAKAIAGFDVSNQSAIYKAATDYQSAADPAGKEAASKAYAAEAAKLQATVDKFQQTVQPGVASSVNAANTAVGQLTDPNAASGTAPAPTNAAPGTNTTSGTGTGTDASGD